MLTSSKAGAGSATGYTTRERVIILAFAFLGTVFDGADFAIFLIFMAPLAAYLHVTLVDMAYIQASSYVIGILGGLLFGSLADRRGRRFGLAATVLVYSIFTLLTAFTTSYAELFVIRLLAGIGIGGEAGIAFSYVNEAFPAPRDRRGLASGLLQSMFLVGSSVAAWIYATTSAHWGPEAWRWAFGLLGAVAILAAAMRLFMPESRLWLADRARAAREGGEAASSVPAIAMFRRGRALTVVVATLMLGFSFYGAYAVNTYSPAMWQTVYKVPAAMVGKLSGFGTLAGGAAYIIAGALSDALGRRSAYTLMAGIGVVAYALFLLSILGWLGANDPAGPQGWLSPVVIAFFLTQIGYGYFGVQGVWLSELFPSGMRTTAQNFIYYGGRALGGGAAPVLGLLAARAIGLGTEFAVGFGLVGVLGALILCRFLPESRGRALT